MGWKVMDEISDDQITSFKSGKRNFSIPKSPIKNWDLWDGNDLYDMG
jgi:hypothetical protein